MIAALALSVFLQGIVAVEICKGPVTALIFTSNSEILAGGEGQLARFDSAGQGLVRYRRPFGKMTDIVAMANEMYFISSNLPSLDGYVHGIHRSFGASLSDIHMGPAVQAVAFRAESHELAAGLFDGTVFVRSTKRYGEPLHRLTGHSGAVFALRFLPAGRLLSGGRDGGLRLWNTVDGKLIRTLSFHTGPIHAIAVPGVVQGPAWCATASEDRTIRIWQPEIGRMVRIIRGAEGPLLALAITPDGTRLLSGGAEGIVRLQSVDGGDPVATWSVPGEWVHSVAISPDGKRAAFGASDGKVRLVDLPK